MEIKGLYTNKVRYSEVQNGEIFVTGSSGGDPWMKVGYDGKVLMVALDTGYTCDGYTCDPEVYLVKGTLTLED